MAAIEFWKLGLDPVALEIGPFVVRWYGLAYVAGFVVAAFIARSLVKRWKVGLTDDDLLDLVLAGVVGLVVGARLGYVLFYGVDRYLEHPLEILRIQDGGMSFHGGLVGILLAGYLVSRVKHVPFLRIADLAVGAPLGILFGRLANFVNGELWGRATDVPWAFIPAPGDVARHPSQLYEAFFEGLVLFTILWVLSRRKRGDGFIIGSLLALYAVFRITIEFFREPDTQLGFIAGPFTMGQLLSVPMIVLGGWLVWRAARGDRGAEGAGTTDAGSADEASS